ncbi:hypothetical protein CFS9_37860 [Flavobacterium sp. CFS9]|uniref:TonB protein C-terminal n=1 Tax=Flavobacterium sp. CFS9 TaxID=3143118 RepID=A0AAT9H6S1_9FLAO
MRNTFFALFSFALLFSCQNNPKPVEKKAVKKVERKSQNKLHENDNKVYNFGSVGAIPKYPGGIQKFHIFLTKNYVAPKEVAEDEQLAGAVFASMIIEKDGTLSDIKILRDFGYGSGEELERVLKLCPNWIPGTINGEPVRCLFSIPFYVQ